jgi:hypothetical protein
MVEMTSSDPPTKRQKPNADRPSEEYQRFERLTKRLLKVPKKDLEEQEAKEKKRAG